MICGLLKTDPDERLTIQKVMKSEWVSVCLSFSSTHVLHVTSVCGGVSASCVTNISDAIRSSSTTR